MGSHRPPVRVVQAIRALSGAPKKQRLAPAPLPAAAAATAALTSRGKGFGTEDPGSGGPTSSGLAAPQPDALDVIALVMELVTASVRTKPL